MDDSVDAVFMPLWWSHFARSINVAIPEGCDIAVFDVYCYHYLPLY